MDRASESNLLGNFGTPCTLGKVSMYYTVKIDFFGGISKFGEGLHFFTARCICI